MVYKGDHSQTVTACRACGHDRFHPYLDLGQIPLVNRYVDPGDDRPEPRFPLRIQKCVRCHLSMLDLVVDPKVLYDNYAYQSSISNIRGQAAGVQTWPLIFQAGPVKILSNPAWRPE